MSFSDGCCPGNTEVIEQLDKILHCLERYASDIRHLRACLAEHPDPVDFSDKVRALLLLAEMMSIRIAALGA